MILFLILLLLLFIVLNSFLGMALEVVGFIFAGLVILIVFIIRRRRSK